MSECLNQNFFSKRINQSDDNDDDDDDDDDDGLSTETAC